LWSEVQKSLFEEEVFTEPDSVCKVKSYLPHTRIEGDCVKKSPSLLVAINDGVDFIQSGGRIVQIKSQYSPKKELRK